ncbi:MAG: ATP-binding protein [Bacilli bacterium]|nr:ATP-binding protein [Bacilli bacterium]
MKLIKRDSYLDKLIEVAEAVDIKVITGLRRSGKSKLLLSFIKYLSKNKKNNIIHIDFNNSKFDNLKENHALENFIESKYIGTKHNYVLIDEIQNCEHFETALNSLHSKEKFRLYVTGSNAFLMSSDLATLFTGRTFEIEVFPFSFKEYKKYYDIKQNYPAFDNFIKEGGMSGSYIYKNQTDKITYLKNVYRTLIIRDITQKYKIRNKELINKISSFMADNISNITSSRNISNFLSTNKDKINHKTVGAYLQYLCNSFLFYKVGRYDIKGKQYLSTSDKYYLSDHAFRYSLIGTKDANTGRILENIVAIELLRRGYEIYVGVLRESEIDFVAIRNGIKTYIQVADDIANKNTLERELKPLLSIKDGFQKMIIARTRSETYQIEGITIIDIANWLDSD